MDAYRIKNEQLVKMDSLWSALNAELVPHMIISLVGAGGKTSIMYKLAEELENMGKRVIITTTTHIFRPVNKMVLIAETASEAAKLWNGKEIAVIGMEWKDSKLQGMSLEETAKLAKLADVLLIEADGARRLPLKVPGREEPVLLSKTDIIIACAGLDSIGQPLNQVCFRFERAAELLHTSKEHCVTAEDIAEIMTSESGAIRNVIDKTFRIVLNKADNKERKE